MTALCRDVFAGFAGIEEDAELAPLSLYRCGGRSEMLLRPRDMAGLTAALRAAHECGAAVNIVGNGSNILFSDRGVSGLVIKLDSKELCSFSLDGGLLEAGAGTGLAAMVVLCRDKGLSGFEFLWGVPATVGGALVMNAGAQGREISDTVERVEIAGWDGGVRIAERAELDFAYRSSSLGSAGVVTRAWFRLEPAAVADIEAMIALCRKQKAWIKDAAFSCGCVFKNPEGTSAGRLLDSLGAKGMREGGAMVSAAHANVIVNAGGASATDIFTLMLRLEELALEAGWHLEPEIKLMGDFTL